MVHSTANYCAPGWCRSAHTHLTDPVINDALRSVTGCMRPTPADNLPILAGIQPAELRRKGATLSVTRRAMEPGYLLQSPFQEQPGSGLNTSTPVSGVARFRSCLHKWGMASSAVGCNNWLKRRRTIY